MKFDIKSVANNLSKAIVGSIAAIDLMLIGTKNVFAYNPSDIANDISSGEPTNGVFSQVTNTATNASKSAYGLFYKVAIAVIIIGFMAAGISIALNGSGQKTEQNKGWLARLVIAAVVVFGAVSLVTMLANVGSTLWQTP